MKRSGVRRRWAVVAAAVLLVGGWALLWAFGPTTVSVGQALASARAAIGRAGGEDVTAKIGTFYYRQADEAPIDDVRTYSLPDGRRVIVFSSTDADGRSVVGRLMLETDIVPGTKWSTRTDVERVEMMRSPLGLVPMWLRR